MTLIDLSTVVRAPAGQVFDLSLDVDAHTASMARSGERIVAGVRAGRMGPGDTVTWAARHFGVPWRMTSRITAYERPHRFVDEQVRGPFRRWRHEHTFAEDPARGVTVMRDVIDFAAPLGVAGRLAERLVLERYLRRLIAERNAHLVAAQPYAVRRRPGQRHEPGVEPPEPDLLDEMTRARVPQPDLHPGMRPPERGHGVPGRRRAGQRAVRLGEHVGRGGSGAQGW